MKYKIDLGEKWSRPMTMSKVFHFYKNNCQTYGSIFSDWISDMKRCSLIKVV